METGGEVGSPAPGVVAVATRRKRDLDSKKAVNPTLLQLGQTVARGDFQSPSDIVTLPPSGSNNQYSVSAGSKRRTVRDAPKTLDGFLLLDCCHVEFPDEVVQAVLSDMRITNVVAEDLLFFSSLARLDMSDNEAPLEPFGCLPALVELDFQCNAVDELALGNGFQNLEVLNLSFNCLGSKDVEELSNLLRIRELYLGNNRIRSLPPIMDRFSRLETISLEHNNISGQEVFSFLSIVPRLRNLNLSHNRLTGFPESALTLEDKRGAGFYNLIYLNLAHNQITEEAGVVHTSELRNLRKLILYGNPIAHAAVTSYDPTKLAYDPVPTLTASLGDRSTETHPVVVVVAYPGTKKKKPHAMSSYEHVEIYKMIPNEVALQSPFRNRTTDFMLGEAPDTVGDEELLAKKQQCFDSDNTPVIPPIKQLRFDSGDSTFLTGVGIEDVLVGSGSTTELPAVPMSMITRSLAPESRTLPAMNSRMAVNALRYQLDHPLTSHDDSDLFPSNSQRPTKSQLLRQRPRRALPSRKDPAKFHAHGQSNNKGSELCRHKGSIGVDDALTELSHQIASTWDKRARGTAERGVDEALESLISTAQKLNLTFHRPQQPGVTPARRT